MMSETKLDLVTFRDAAKEIGKNEGFLRNLAIRDGIAIDWGGTPRRKLLKVSLEAMKRAVLGNKYRRTAGQKRARRLVQGGAIHPLVKC
jgi:hypothetical protein